MQGQILSAFFWGYLISQVPASYLAKNYGPKHVVFGGMSVLFVATMLSPEAVRISPGLLIALQVIKGLGSVSTYIIFLKIVYKLEFTKGVSPRLK